MSNLNEQISIVIVDCNYDSDNQHKSVKSCKGDLQSLGISSNNKEYVELTFNRYRDKKGLKHYKIYFNKTQAESIKEKLTKILKEMK